MLTLPGRSGANRRMSTRTRLRRTGVITAGLLILVAGCTTSTANGPTTTPMATMSGTPSAIDPSSLRPSSSVAPPSPSPSDPGTPAVTPESTPVSSDISPQEAADRAAIEAQWIKFWDVYTNIIRTPSDNRDSILSEVSIDPIKSEILDVAKRFEFEGIDYYGSVIHDTYWASAIGGSNYAIIRDCMDQSQYGSLYVSTGETRSTGVPRDHIQGGFTRGDDGVWRVQNFQYIIDVKC